MENFSITDEQDSLPIPMGVSHLHGLLCPMVPVILTKAKNLSVTSKFFPTSIRGKKWRRNKKGRWIKFKKFLSTWVRIQLVLYLLIMTGSLTQQQWEPSALSLVCKQDAQKGQPLLRGKAGAQGRQRESTKPGLVDASTFSGSDSSCHSFPTEFESHTTEYT